MHICIQGPTDILCLTYDFASFITIPVPTGAAVGDQQHISWTIQFPQ